MSEITRRSFVRKSTAAAAIAGNAAVLNGLINATGSAGEGDTTQPGTTQPGTTGPNVKISEVRTRPTAVSSVNTTPYSTKSAAEQAAKQRAEQLRDQMQLDPNVSPNPVYGPKGNMVPCFEISPAPSTPFIQITGNDTEGWNWQVTIPAGSVTFIYYKDPSA